MSQMDPVGSEQGYTIEAVEAYLLAATQKRSDLQDVLAAARARRDAASDLERRLRSLELRVGHEVVSRLAARREPGGTAELDSVSAQDRTTSVRTNG